MTKNNTQSISSHIKYVRFFSRLIGLYCDESNFFATKHYWKYTFFMYAILLGAFMTSYTVTLITSTSNLEMLAEVCHDYFSFLVGLFKVLWMVANWSTIKKLVDQLDDEDFQPKNLRQKKMTDEFAYSFHVYYCMFSFNVVLGVSVYTLNPLLDEQTRNLPMNLTYPYDSKRVGLYEISFLHQFVVIMFTCLVQGNVDALMIILMVYIGIQCDLISDSVRHLKQLSEQKVAKYLSKSAENFNGVVLKEMENGLVDCILHHQKVLRFKDESKYLFSVLIFAQFSTSSISLCTSMFQLNVLSPSESAFYAALAYQFAILVQLGSYCWFGNEVITRSSNICQAIYDCEWFECSHNFKMNMVFFMRRVQKPMKIVAVDVFALSLETARNILRTSWSAFTVLRQVANQ